MKPVERILLLGDKEAAGRWVSLVRHQADMLERSSTGVRNTKLVKIPDGWALIKLDRRQRRYIIKVEESLASYEFFTSEYVYRSIMATPGYEGIEDEEGTSTFVCGRASYHRVRGGVVSKPLLELCGDCDTDPEVVSWPVADCADIAAEAAMRTQSAWQNQRSWEYVWWPANAGGQFVVSAAGAVSGYSHLGRLSRFNYTAGEISLAFWRDFGFDILPARFTGESKTPDAYGAPGLSDPHWYRRACTLTVEGRTFMVMTDHVGVFYFFDAELYENGVVPEGDYVAVTPSYPAWCEAGLGLWTFNSTGRRAACCPYERKAPPLTKGGEAVLKDTLRGYYRVEPANEPVYNQPAYEDEPGLIEVEIDITLNPDGSFSPSVTVVREEQFGTSGRFAVYADYLIGDDRLPYPSDTLVVLSQDLWIQGGNYNLNGVGDFYYPDDYAGIVRAALVIEAMVDGAWTEVARIPTRWNVKTEADADLSPTNYDVDGITLTAFSDTISAFDVQNFDYAAVVSHMNLRTLSWVARHQTFVDPTSGYDRYVCDEIVAYLESVSTQGDPQAIAAKPAWNTLGYARADTEKLELWGMEYHATFEAHPFTGPCFHPKGHWSVSSQVANLGQANTPNVLDTVNFRINGADMRTTHKALYNAAFGDDRDYAYYSGAPDPDARSGVFRTFGIFRGK